MSSIVIEGRARIPDGIADLESFRRWTQSDEFPEEGRFSYLDGQLWVDWSMEELFTHNQVKAAITFAIMALMQELPLGRFVPDRMRLTNLHAGLSTEPDGLFYKWETMRDARLRLVSGAHEGAVELEGAPDLVIEVVSRASVIKDNQLLRQLYFDAGIPEYWLIDARSPHLQFEILQATSGGYAENSSGDGWHRSEVLQHDFQLARQVDPLGHPSFELKRRPITVP